MPAPLSFLFLGYREEVWYYEFIVMAKKYSLIAITVFLNQYSRYQIHYQQVYLFKQHFLFTYLLDHMIQ